MKRSYFSLFNVTSLGIIILLFLATLWLWRGFWRNQQFDQAVEKQVTAERNASEYALPTKLATTTTIDSISEIPTTSAAQIIIAANTVSTTPEEKIENNNSASHVAISPLTGALTLGEDDVNLIVPYASQAPERNWDQPWQDACEEAALLMLDAYYKGYGLSPLSAKDEMQKMIDWETEQGWGGSVDIEHIKKIANDYLNFKKKIIIVENPSVEQIKKFIDVGNPVLVVADGKVLPNKYYANGGPMYHALIIRGYTADKFITNDPGVNRGANFVFPIEAVMNALHDWNDGDVKNGRKVILVLE
ncbi:MAG: hypothetical protein A2821_01465 [Candidatus Magasanikbacteria bacterium RIFCSPHIGHO2_01_FULL_41_23]|uniref:Peptidase C39-like domain-containing protein n=1 Tax=Candidatus Magasanikbacteria bacterium RIFCSPLOWO2_01_FULL_40_15 TaxID=1798686 RepID=A0A1F6N4M1_9BACT|nr:MAG: hypothetical protein A2821_01465 [Candidatus Magasanikbacteria bacterium RIFCSPHIGHO2_01_FULL_41_23]OGH66792.1 MAG: hypothetical protein A3C66_01770 [Candidatus Magasanikbacteria bacterium RIFCSPHIGHO2_02_FULL_41_35]OGH76688.1 MAG: hypothetical protein A3F22_01155 [Candidatus Magasanikbacteria bacterium RIFCSPHIGHO2_12_FULL_41_16]OGH78879.1 MAG: hypothetical protein A2983_00925 [Candidatus Magasanikbacteria bacterium RIFCSPLOWO2_01_FULL_40_15]